MAKESSVPKRGSAGSMSRFTVRLGKDVFEQGTSRSEVAFGLKLPDATALRY